MIKWNTKTFREMLGAITLLIAGFMVISPAMAQDKKCNIEGDWGGLLCNLHPQVSGADYRIENEVVVFDLWKYFETAGINDINERVDVIYLLTALQGIVNREQPRLYLYAALALFDVETKHYYDPDYRDKPLTELDKYWFKQLGAWGWLEGTPIKQIDTLEELISHFEGDVGGLVAWDMTVPATVNLAMMSAGVDNLLPVGHNFAGDRLLKWMDAKFPQLEVKLDLAGRFTGVGSIDLGERSVPSTGSAKNDVYRYALEKYLKAGHLNPYYNWYNCDAAMWGEFRSHYAQAQYGYLGDRNEVQQNGMYNGDYWVAKRAFLLDLSPWGDEPPRDEPGQILGTDLNSWNDILHESYTQRKGEFGMVGGFPPWWIKYTDIVGGSHGGVPTEWEFIGLITSYNCFNEGDAAFGIANASFFMHLPQLTREECTQQKPEPIEYEEGTTYLCFFMMDYDGSAWVNQMVPTIYDDPNRGKIPLNWSVNAIIHRRVPHAMRYLYENRTPLDFFGMSDDGVGYLDPLALSDRHGRVKESGIPFYESIARRVQDRYDNTVTAFYIAPRFESPWIDMAARIDKEGFGFNRPMQATLVNDTPVSYLESHHVGGKQAMIDSVDNIFESSIGNEGMSPSFKAFRCILMTPAMIVDAVEKARAKYPNAKVKVVDYHNYFRLLREKLTRPLKSPFMKLDTVEAVPTRKKGVQAVSSPDGVFKVSQSGGVACWLVEPVSYGCFLYFDVDDAFSAGLTGKVTVEVTYWDEGTESIELQYDSTDPSAPLDGAYKSALPKIELSGKPEWKTMSFELNDIKFSNRENYQTDLRFFCMKEPIRVSRIKVSRR